MSTLYLVFPGRKLLRGLRSASNWPTVIVAAIAVGTCLLAVQRWAPPLRSGLLLLIMVGIGFVWRSLDDAFYDRLTRLPNRRLFLKQVEQFLIQRKKQQIQPFSIFFLDLDQFKVANDSLGRKGGDLLLKAITQRLRRCVPSNGILARVGGNEFAILRWGIANMGQVTLVAHRLHAALIPPFFIDGQEIQASVSIGIALSPGYSWAEDLLKDAQIAMYRAKNQGGGRHAVFHPDMRAQPMYPGDLEADLRLALERQELRLYYQALVSLRTGRITGFEALVRWEHPEHGLIPPGNFIPLAEEMGLITLLDRWTLYNACKQLRTWQDRFPSEPPMLISVNLSSKLFAQPDLIDQIRRVLRDTGVDGRTLKLEITESTVMENLDAAIATLKQIKTLNVRLGLDDFGTGYSSLSHLYHFPTDTLKVDQSFVQRMGSDNDNDEIIRTIITLAHTLGMNVIAEGIETPQQLELLRSLECEYGQGYLFSQPLSREQAEALLAEAPCW